MIIIGATLLWSQAPPLVAPWTARFGHTAGIFVNASVLSLGGNDGTINMLPSF